jgi:hydrogenase maturation protease
MGSVAERGNNVAPGKRYILGIGNYAQRDDGIGLRVVERIVDQGRDQGFDAIEVGNNGLSVLTYFEAATERLLVVDCARMERAPGDAVVFGPDDVTSRKIPGNISTHEGDILKLIELGKQLGYPIPEIRILAIEPGVVEPGLELSEAVAQKLDEYVETAIVEITS